jgi:hypothetical protein
VHVFSFWFLIMIYIYYYYYYGYCYCHCYSWCCCWRQEFLRAVTINNKIFRGVTHCSLVINLF